MLVGKFNDAFGNTATIVKETIIPYKGATKAADAYKLSLTADYDSDYLYHVSVHETLDDAIKEMNKCSAGTWDGAYIATDGKQKI